MNNETKKQVRKAGWTILLMFLAFYGAMFLAFLCDKH